MAASIYATPPPDLIGEDTGLSDTSSSSVVVQNNNNNNNISSNRTDPSNVVSTDSDNLESFNTTGPVTSSYLASDLFDGSDAAKNKRRKQTTPLRISAGKNPNGGEGQQLEQDQIDNTDPTLAEDVNNDSDEEEEQDQEQYDTEKCKDDDKLQLIESNLSLQEKMEGGLLDNLDIVQRAALLISHMQKNQKNNEKTAEFPEMLSTTPTDLSISSHNQTKVNNGNSNHNIEDERDEDCTRGQSQIANLKLLMSEIIENKDCADCGTKFDSSLKLKMHIFQEHGHSVMRYPNEEGGTLLSGSDSELMSKLQMASSHHQQQQMLGKPEDWMSLAAGLSFSFPSDASSYPMPLLGMSSQVQMGSFVGGGAPSLDALSRPGPPLRIFNPEAYCDLCNKEFCNKYFLKTHRANKHGIYEHSSNASDSSTSNPATVPPPVIVSNAAPQSISALQATSSPVAAASSGHVIQQQQQCKSESTQQQQQQVLNGNLTPCDSGTVNCDICMKKFANTFAMKRHRTKAHETPASADKSDQNQMLSQGLEGERSNPNPNPLIRFPDDFRPDFSVEQEDASFTPQPRKLSPVSSQQARESNFSVDKLKRLGVLNPEAFCELCCKEYCNKYFLRTHKLKRHGILMPPDEVKDGMMQQQQQQPTERNPWQFLQANPLNLMLGEFNPIQQLQQKFLSEMTELANRKPNSKSPPAGGIQVVKMEEDGKSEGEMHIGRSDDSPSLMSPLVKRHVDNHNNKSSDGNSPSSPSESQNEQHQVDVDAISMDLQKLQSMILQLNDLNANHQAQQIIPCHLCGKELENQYLFHAHLMAEHGHMPENAALSATKSCSVSPVGGQGQLQQQQLPTEFCKHCDKDFPNAGEFKQHLFEVHGIVQRPGSVSPTREGFVTPDRPTATNLNSGISTSMPATPTGERRPPYTMTPTSSYCEICNKELCNKYFMKTHMQRMHGIEIENGSQIGGVVCNICNKELCSKYFLRVHKHNTHGIVEDGAPLPPQIAAKVNGEAAAAAAAAAAASAGTPSSSSASGQDINEEVCPLCTRRFRSAKWLRAHLMSDHGKAGIDRLKELEQRMSLSKGSGSPQLKIPNGGSFPGMLNHMFAADSDPMKQFSAGMNPGMLSSDNNLDDSNNNNKNANSKLKEYQCSFCSFSTPYYAFLFIHERSHSLMNPVAMNNAMLRNVSPMLPNALLNDYGQFKGSEEFRGMTVHNSHPHPFASQSESAVSIAKDLFHPINLGQPTAASITPTSTPASTPGIGVGGMAEVNTKVGQELESDEEERQQPPRKKSRTNRNDASPGIRSENFLRRFSVSGDSIPMGKLSRLESSHMLKDMANMTKRPAIYALPKESEPMIMQSFLIEETRSGRERQKLSDDVEDSENRKKSLREDALALVMANNNNNNNNNCGSNGELRKSASGSEELQEMRNRFVPAVVFLPVRERISTPVTISFTLTPA